MRTIYKYEVPIKDDFFIPLPIGAKVLSFQMQGTRPTIWVQLNDENDIEKRQFRIYGTGEDMPNILINETEVYVGTVQDAQNLVWHLFEVIK